MSARRQSGAGLQADPDRLWRPVPQHPRGRPRVGDAGAGLESSNLEDGQPHHHRLRDFDEQRLRSHRSMLVVRFRTFPNRCGGSPPIHRPRHDRVYGWQRTCSNLGDRHANADPVRAHLSRPRGSARTQDRLGGGQEMGIPAARFCQVSSAEISLPVPGNRRQRYVYRSEEHTSELQSPCNLVCRLLLEKKEHTSELQSPCNLVCRLLLEKKKNTCYMITSLCALSYPHYCPLLFFFLFFFFFFLNDPAPPKISPFPLHAPLPI